MYIMPVIQFVNNFNKIVNTTTILKNTHFSKYINQIINILYFWQSQQL